MRYATTILLIQILGISGCGGAVPVIEAVGTVASTTGAWFSYKALQQDPVQVTTVAKECVLGMKYISIGCPAWEVMTDVEKQSISVTNRTLVEICGADRPPPTHCP